MSASELRLPAPAKLNLCLRALARRDDGYHEIQTAYQFVDLHDELDLALDDDLRIFGDMADEGNLALAAARLLRRRLGVSRGGRIHLRKRIPVGAGLGGGSSDAAAALVGFNRLWDGGLSVDALADLGAELGADVPVFIRGRAAWGEGVGERLRPCDFPESRYLLLAPCVASTREVFAMLKISAEAPLTLEDFLRNGAGNDCEAAAAARYPPIAQALAWLRSHAPARMTGAGAGVFAEIDSPETMDKLLKLAPRHWLGFKLRGMNRSPLLRWLPDVEPHDWGVAKR